MAENKPSTSSIKNTRRHGIRQSASPIDGRWAVLVAIAAFIGRGIVALQGFSMPIFTVEWEKRLGATPSQVSWATTLVTSPRFLIAPVAAALNRKFGCRPIVFVGGISAMASILLLSMTNKLWQIFVCSFVIGTSMGLVIQGTVIVVSEYFDKWLGRANGFAFSGAGIGIMAGSPLVVLLIDVFTWRGALLIMAGIAANLSVAGAVYRPLTWWTKGKRSSMKSSVRFSLTNDRHRGSDPGDAEMKTTQIIPAYKVSNCSEPEGTTELRPFVSQGNPAIAARAKDSMQVVRCESENTVTCSDVQFENAKPEMTKTECMQCNESNELQSQTEAPLRNETSRSSLQDCSARVRLLVSTIIDLFGFSLLWRNSNVLLLCIIAIIQGGGYFPSYVYLPSYIVSSGETELRASFIPTILGISSLVGRLTHGFLIDFKLISPANLYGTASILAGCSVFVIVMFKSYEAFIVYAIIFGLGTGTKNPLCPVMTKKYTAPSEMANAVGLESLFAGIGQLVGTYFLGILFDWTNAYRSCFCLAGALLFIDGLVAFLIEPWNRWRHRHRLQKH